MIRTTDLMLGNWVEYTTEINNDKRSIPMQVKGIFADNIYLDFEGNEGDVLYEADENLRGIPITEEILEKCYFDKVAPKIWKDGKAMVYLYGEECDKTIWAVYRENMRVEVSYLHQLQNAYFMLTGKRLNIKL